MLLGGYTPLLPLSHTIAWQHRLQNIILRLHLRRPRRFPNELSAFGSDERPKQSRVRWSSMDWLIELRFYVPLDTKWVTSDTWKRWLLPIVNDSCILHPCSACNRRIINFYMMMMMMIWWWWWWKTETKSSTVVFQGLIDWLIELRFYVPLTRHSGSFRRRSSQGTYFWKHPDVDCTKISSVRPAVSIEFLLVTDRDRYTHRPHHMPR